MSGNEGQLSVSNATAESAGVYKSFVNYSRCGVSEVGTFVVTLPGCTPQFQRGGPFAGIPNDPSSTPSSVVPTIENLLVHERAGGTHDVVVVPRGNVEQRPDDTPVLASNPPSP
jgi:hypothetical protein